MNKTILEVATQLSSEMVIKVNSEMLEQFLCFREAERKHYAPMHEVKESTIREWLLRYDREFNVVGSVS